MEKQNKYGKIAPFDGNCDFLLSVIPYTHTYSAIGIVIVTFHDDMDVK